MISGQANATPDQAKKKNGPGYSPSCDQYNPMKDGVLEASKAGQVSTQCYDESMTRVIITGERPEEDNDWIIIWPREIFNYWGGGGGGGGGGDGTSGDDGTKGTAEVAGRQAGCLGEQLFMEAVASQVTAGQAPIGSFVPVPITDPAYPGRWLKYQTSTISNSYPSLQNYKIQQRIIVHYLYNIDTHAVAQMKLKNSYEYGCVGIKKPLGG